MKKAILLTSCAVISLVSIQDANADAATDAKISRIEKRMIALEKQVYSGKSMVGSNVSADNKLLAQTQVQLDNMQEQNSKLYGKIEELSYAVEKLTEQVKLISEDFDYRLNELENKSEMNKETSANVETTVANPTVSAKPEPAREKSVVPDLLTVEKIYEKAYNYLTSAKYDKATDWFEAIIERFPQHKYADNSYYWLGEIALVQGDPKKAILSFSKGLKNFPTGQKAPSNLLKIGVAFKQKGNLDHAKNSWNKLIKDYPNDPLAKTAKEYLLDLDK